MKNYQDGGEAIVEAFRNLGVEYIISSPGSEWSPVWEAMSRQTIEKKPGPKFIQCWHESLAVNMATGYTFVTGKPQAVLVHAGVGLLHGAMSIRCAMQAETPMILMSGESVSLGEDPEQGMEPQWYGGVSPGGADKLVAPFVKWAGMVHSQVTLYQSIVRAGEMSTRTPKGPVYLDVPLEHMLAEWSAGPNLKPVPPAPKTQALTADAERIAQELAAAKNPMIVVELAGIDPAAFTALVELSEALAIPVIGGRGTSYANFPSDHPMWQGIESYSHLVEADLVLLVGGRTPWFPPSKRPTEGRIIAINDHPFKDWLVYQNLLADEYVEGNVAASLSVITEAINAVGVDAAAVEARRARWSDAHDAYMGGLKSKREEVVAAGDLDPLSVCAAMEKIMPADTIYVDETITHFPVMRNNLPITRPQTLFRHTGGALGQGMGLALGIKLASPDHPVVLFLGDGAMLYNPVIQALGASREHNLPLIIVVMNNGIYKAMKKGHVHFYEDGAAAADGYAHGVQIGGPEYHELGVHFGMTGARAETYAEFKTALENVAVEAKAGKTSIINAIVPE
ncbi:MAG: thiamine pyrophosphate-binding protein [Rhodospirillales bacterium]|nr:thiamine pyrophosphate-binding protein [Rhodospirillales bacterium]